MTGKQGSNARKGAKGFQKTGAVSPDGVERESLLTKIRKAFTPRDERLALAEAKQASHAFLMGSTTYGDTYAAVAPAMSAEWRFGVGNREHARIDDTRQELLFMLHERPIDYDTGHGESAEHVHFNFSPQDVLPLVRRLAYQVVEASEGTNNDYQANPRVYSARTLECAKRIMDANGDAFRTQKFEGEGTELFPYEKTVTPAKPGSVKRVDYAVYLHQDVSALVEGVQRDQEQHAGLQAGIAEEAERRATRQRKWESESDPFADL